MNKIRAICNSVINVVKQMKWSVRIALLIAIVIFFSGTGILITGQPGFCNSCHIMNPFYESWENSSHSHVNCLDCHLHPGLTSYAMGKINGLAQAVACITGRVGTKPNATVVNASCLRSECHSTEELVTKNLVYSGMKFTHEVHVDKVVDGIKITCGLCHSHVEGNEHFSVNKEVCFTCHFLKGSESDDRLVQTSCQSCHEVPDKVIERGFVSINHAEFVSYKASCDDSCHKKEIEIPAQVSANACLNCHDYSSEFHFQKSCGNASCHGANSDLSRMTFTGSDTLHRMGMRYGDPRVRDFDPDLVLDMRFEGNLKDSGEYRLDSVWSLGRPNPANHALCADDSAPGAYVAGRSGQAIEINDQPVEVGTEDCDWSTQEGRYTDYYNDNPNDLSHAHPGHGTWKYTEMKYNMTVEAWVYPTVDTNERKILAKHTYGSGGYALVLEKIDVFGNESSNGLLRAEFMTNVNGGSGTGDCGGLRGAYSSVPIPLNRWTHVAATYDSTGPDRDATDGSVGRIRIYVNGEDVTTSSSNVAKCYAQPGPGEDAMYPNSDHNGDDPGSWWGSALSIGGMNWSD